MRSQTLLMFIKIQVTWVMTAAHFARASNNALLHKIRRQTSADRLKRDIALHIIVIESIETCIEPSQWFNTIEIHWTVPNAKNVILCLTGENGVEMKSQLIECESQWLCQCLAIPIIVVRCVVQFGCSLLLMESMRMPAKTINNHFWFVQKGA